MSEVTNLGHSPHDLVIKLLKLVHGGTQPVGRGAFEFSVVTYACQIKHCVVIMDGIPFLG